MTTMLTVTNAILANSASSNFTKVAFIALFLAGILFLLVGVWLGWMIWKGYREEAERIEKENRRMIEDHELRERNFKGHKDRATGIAKEEPKAVEVAPED